MTAPQSADVSAIRRRRNSRRAFWLIATLFVLAILLLATPGSPLYLPTLLVRGGTYEGRSVGYWVKQLNSDDPASRTQAIFALGAIGTDAESAVPALVHLLQQDDDETVRSESAQALGKMAPASRIAVLALAEALRDPCLQVRMNAANALARIGRDAGSAIPALIESIEDETNQTNLNRFHLTIQEMAVVALGRVGAGSDEAVSKLVAIIDDDGNDGLRGAAARGLGDIGEKARPTIPQLRKLLADNSGSVRESADIALEKLGANSEQRKPLATNEAPEFELPDSERVYLWQIENRGNELVQHGFRALGKVLKDSDEKALVALLADDFEGTDLHAPRTTRLDRDFATVVRLDRSGPPTRLGREAFVTRLLKLRKEFVGKAPEVKFSLKTLRPSERGQLDGRWEGTAQLRLIGEHAKGAPAEAVVIVSYRVSRLTREALSKPGWLNGAGIEQITLARGTHSLFAEVARQRGFQVDKLHDNWKTDRFAPSTGGVSVTDFNRDGILDVLITDLTATTLYKGKRDGTVEDVTATHELPQGPPANNAIAWIDIDGDGWEDLILGGRVFRNEEGKRFVDYSRRCRLPVPSDVSGLVVADYDCDGKLDLYATRSTKPGGKSWLDSRGADTLGNRLYRNKGNWQFEDVTKASGATGGRRSTFTAAWLDANNDGWPDLHVINEFGDGVLLVNNQNGTFRSTPLADRPADFGSMGLAVGDIDNDGNIDIYCANMFSKAGTRVIGNLKPNAYPADVMEKMRRFVAGSQLHLNKGGLKFEQVGEKMQVASVGWAYGACLADLDNDGWLDVYATAGFVSRSRTEPDG